MIEEFIPFHSPAIGEDEINSVIETLRSGWLTTGHKVKAFEETFANYLGVRHALAVNSCTAALHLALDAVGIHEGDEVIVPTMTFTATAEVVLYSKAKPVLVDCEADTFNIDPMEIDKKISPKTKAVIPVHMGGQSCDMDRIMEISRRAKLHVIEDAAHALPAHYNRRMIGTIGDVTCFSFYATKTITTGEGGMAVTNDPELAEKMRIMSLHGISHDAWKRYSREGTWYYEVLFPGYKYNMTDIAAAIGLEQLKKCDYFRIKRQLVANRYNDGFRDVEEITIPVIRPNLESAWHLYVIQLDLDHLTISRNQFIETLKGCGIGASVHFIPLHLHPYYRDHFGFRPEDLPNSNFVFQRIVSLPIYPNMTDSDVERVISTVRTIIKQFRR